MFSFLNFYAKYKMNRNLEKYYWFETLRQVGDKLTHILTEIEYYYWIYIVYP